MIMCIRIKFLATGGKKPDVLRSHFLKAFLQRLVFIEFNVWPIIESGASYSFFINGKPHGLDEVQRGSGSCAGSGNRAGVLRNLRIYQYDMHKSYEKTDCQSISNIERIRMTVPERGVVPVSLVSGLAWKTQRLFLV